MTQSLLPYTPERDAYRLLGVPASASNDEITAACRRLARTFHPDRNPSARATVEMQVVNTVREVMSDPQTRAMYDRERRRFQEFTMRPPVRPATTRPVDAPSTHTTVERYLRAAVIGVRTTVVALLPTRCRRCSIVIEGEDAYCAACGTPLLTGG
jgi:curved DNA-binding protein CbpA